MDALFEALKLAAVGLFAGLFSAAISNRNHRHLRWWELRVKAYQEAIDALSDLVHVYKTTYNAEIQYLQMPKDSKESYAAEAYPKIRKLADCGSFLFSKKANEALREFMSDDYDDGYIEHLEQNLKKAEKCLHLLVDSSHADLRLDSRWLSKWM